MIGVGAWLMYEAWKSPTPTPLVKAKATLATDSGTSQTFPTIAGSTIA
jgi:hypothetical protein